MESDQDSERRHDGESRGSSELVSRDALEQLREILFGAAHRDVDRRLRRMDAHLSARTHDVEGETKRRVDLLDSHFRREIDALASRFDAEGSDAREAIRALAREHREAMSAIEQRLAKMEDSQLRAHRELRDRILELAKSSIDEVRRVRDDLAATLERELGDEGELIDEDARGAEPAHPH